MTLSLQNKVAVITGGTTGIGLAIALAYQAQGAQVAVCGRSADALTTAAETLGADALVLKADVTRRDDLERLFQETVSRFGKVDVLVANAGVARMAPLADTDEATFDILSDVNFKGAYFTVQTSLAHLAEGASIIVTGSAVSYVGMPGMSAYAATKAAVRSLVRSWSKELAPQGIRVNTLSPGPIETPIFGKMGVPQDQLEGMATEFASQVPLGRFGNVTEMANAALFLGSSASSFVTGSDLVADGGFTA